MHQLLLIQLSLTFRTRDSTCKQTKEKKNKKSREGKPDTDIIYHMFHSLLSNFMSSIKLHIRSQKY